MKKDSDIPAEFFQEFISYFPNTPLSNLIEVDLAHFVRLDEHIDEEALVEILQALQTRFGMIFDINLRNHFPSWLSPMRSDFLLSLVPPLKAAYGRMYRPLTILDIWEEIDKKRTR